MQMMSVAALFWQKIHKFLLLVFLLAAFLGGWYVWQSYLSGSNWSEEKKQNFLNSQNNGVVFNQKNFEKALTDVEARKTESAASPQKFRDVFKAY